jgi:hypothetical protein
MVTFAGVGVFSGGYLARDEASIVLTGQIAPHPYVHHQREATPT